MFEIMNINFWKHTQRACYVIFSQCAGYYKNKNKNKNSLLSKYIEIHWKLLFSAH